MAIPATTAAANVAGSHQAAQTAAKSAPRRDAKPAPIRRPDDELLLHSSEVDGPDAVRHAGGNGDEETREDRQEHPSYSNQPETDQPPHLDISG